MQARQCLPHVTALKLLHAHNAFTAVIGQVVGIGDGRRWQGVNLTSAGPAILIFGSVSKSYEQLVVGHVVNIGCHWMAAIISTATAAESAAAEPTAVIARWSCQRPEHFVLQMTKIGVGVTSTASATTGGTDTISTTIGTRTSIRVAHLLPAIGPSSVSRCRRPCCTSRTSRTPTGIGRGRGRGRGRHGHIDGSPPNSTGEGPLRAPGRRGRAAGRAGRRWSHPASPPGGLRRPRTSTPRERRWDCCCSGRDQLQLHGAHGAVSAAGGGAECRQSQPPRRHHLRQRQIDHWPCVPCRHRHRQTIHANPLPTQSEDCRRPRTTRRCADCAECTPGRSSLDDEMQMRQRPRQKCRCCCWYSWHHFGI